MRGEEGKEGGDERWEQGGWVQNFIKGLIRSTGKNKEIKTWIIFILTFFAKVSNNCNFFLPKSVSVQHQVMIMVNNYFTVKWRESYVTKGSLCSECFVDKICRRNPFRGLIGQKAVKYIFFNFAFQVKLRFCHKLKFSNPYIFRTWWYFKLIYYLIQQN